jgi:glyceraldehyde 3-phosphate dehydrogenase
MTRAKVNASMTEYAQGRIKGSLGYTEEPLGSSDRKGDSHASIFSAPDTLVVGGNLVKVGSWYDNE